MKNDRPTEISVKTVFTGGRTAQQAFVDLILRKRFDISEKAFDMIPNQMYNNAVVFSDVHKAPERGIYNG